MKIMNKIGFYCSLSLSVVAFGGVGEARDFTIAGWGGASQDAYREIYFDPFSKKIGKPVLEDTWGGGYGILQSKVKTGNPNWDVVQVEADELALGCVDGLYEKLDWDKIGVKDDFIPEAASECGAGTNFWTIALAYDGSKLERGPESWADFWDIEKFPGKRALRKGPKGNLEFALLADGVPVQDVYKVLSTSEGVDRAFKKLDEIKPSLVWWESGGQPLQYLASGEVTMASSYNARVDTINQEENTNYKLVWNGSIYAVDSWVILKGAENKDIAQDFIAFASQAELQAKLPQYVSYGVPNKKATALIPEKYLARIPTNPENMKNALSVDTSFWIDNSEILTERFNAWSAR